MVRPEFWIPFISKQPECRRESPRDSIDFRLELRVVEVESTASIPAMLFHGCVNAAPSLGVAFVGDLSSVGVSPYTVLVPTVWVVALALVERYGREALSVDGIRRDGGIYGYG